jgi:hypothetical protein
MRRPRQLSASFYDSEASIVSDALRNPLKTLAGTRKRSS